MKSVFISYGGPDEPFAEKLYLALSNMGIESFFFAKHAPAGEKLHRVMRDGVNQHDKVILICSRNSLDRSGVVNEIEEALQREAREGGEMVLIPVAIDDYVFKDWAPRYPGTAQAVRDRVVADFRRTAEDRKAFNEQLARLIEVLVEPQDAGHIIENIQGHCILEIFDSQGERSKLTWKRTFVPRTPNIDRLQIRDITALGPIDFISTNIGTLTPPLNEGGIFVSYAVLDSPLEINKEVDHIVEVMIYDSFPDSQESFTSRITGVYRRLIMDIILPKARPAYSAEALRVYRGRRMRWPGLDIQRNGLQLHLEVDTPKPDSLFGIEWKW